MTLPLKRLLLASAAIGLVSVTSAYAKESGEGKHTWAEAKSAGTARRSIPNYRQVTEEISDRVGPLLSLKLEGMKLVDQVALFSAADVIIAQHGAALSNLVWARPGTAVVEIMPRTMPQAIQDVGFFSHLAACRQLRHRFVWQDGDHAPVDPVLVGEAARQLLYQNG